MKVSKAIEVMRDVVDSHQPCCAQVIVDLLGGHEFEQDGDIELVQEFHNLWCAINFLAEEEDK